MMLVAVLTPCRLQDFPGYRLWVKRRHSQIEEQRLASKVAELAL